MTLFSGENAFRHIQKMAEEIGARPVGSPNSTRCEDYIEEQFKSLGLKTWRQEFTAKVGIATHQSLQVTEPYQTEVKCEAMHMMGSTGPEGVEGELIYIETTDEEYLTPAITGKIVISTSFTRSNIDKVAKLKPLGFIIIERNPHMRLKHFWGNQPPGKDYGSFPSVRIGFEDGLSLLKRGAKTARLTVQAEQTTVKVYNIIGELEGSEKPEEIILVGGHYDSVPDVKGASDNAGGTALTMELARVFKTKGTKRTMRFIAWGGEEMGLYGSNHYARTLKADDKQRKEKDKTAETELDHTRLVVNLDVHGAMIGTNSSSILGPGILTDSAKLLSKETGTVYDVKEQVYSSDGTPLSAVGVPSISFSRRSGIDIMMHSNEDTIEWLSPAALELQGSFIETWITRYVAEAAAFPFPREVPEDQLKQIKEYYKRWKAELP